MKLLKRKLIQINRIALYVQLPMEWSRLHKLRKKQYIHVEQYDNKIVIKPIKKDKIEIQDARRRQEVKDVKEDKIKS